MSDNKNKVVIVTGGSSGIGRATVREFLKQGFTVYSCARRVELMKDLEGEGAKIIQLDVTKSSSIKACIKQIVGESGRIDVLVNNAGYGSYGTVEDVPISEAKTQFEVNLFGLAEMTQVVLPIMRNQSSGRIINIGSMGGKVWFPLGAWYHATKHAVEGFSDCLRYEVKPFGIKVVLIEPGIIKSEWMKISMEHLQKVSPNSAYKVLIDKCLKMYFDSEKMGRDPSNVAGAIYKASTQARPKARYVVGLDARAILIIRRLLPDSVYDWVIAMYSGVPKKMG